MEDEVSLLLYECNDDELNWNVCKLIPTLVADEESKL
jgi:hypothetical protein